MMTPEVSHEHRSDGLQIGYDLQAQQMFWQERSYLGKVMLEHAFSFSQGLVSPLTG